MSKIASNHALSRNRQGFISFRLRFGTVRFTMCPVDAAVSRGRVDVEMAKREIELSERETSLIGDSFDDCLSEAELRVAKRESVETWQVTARWTDEQRNTITVEIDD